MTRLIAPSVLSADFGNLDAMCSMIESSAAAMYHLDIMDGVFVPNISFGFPVCKAIAAKAVKPLDAHLMIVDPDRYVDRFAELGIKYLSVHYEACGRNLRRVLQHIRACGMKAGVAINPDTPAESLIRYLHDADFIVVMGVFPGFSGQKYIPETTEKVAVLSEMIAAAQADCFIEVDGGVGMQNIAQLASLGAKLFVAGAAAFGADDPVAAIAALSGD